MKRIIYLCLLLCLLLPSLAAAGAYDFTVDNRSQLHLFCSAPFGALADVLAYQGIYQFDRTDRLIFATVAGSIPGAYKEWLIDAWPDLGDMTFNVAGAFLGAWLAEEIQAKLGPSAHDRYLLTIAGDNNTIMLALHGRF